MSQQNQRQISEEAAEGLTAAQVGASSAIWAFFHDCFITKGAETLTRSREGKKD